VPASQAEEMGIFAVGDRLQGVGELPLAAGGFEKAVEMVRIDSMLKCRLLFCVLTHHQSSFYLYSASRSTPNRQVCGAAF